ncbi:MAG: tyrosine-protein phosphatase [Proteobacteria bacterium]|nr:tyrosine-protein phosphatase [Pseudomonadota bacterium]
MNPTTVSRQHGIGVLLAATVLATACAAPAFAADPAAQALAAADAPPAPLRLHAPREGLLTAGQPGAGDWQALAAKGVATVIDLRTDGERPGRDERAEVTAAGMAYHAIPVAGAEALTADNASRLWTLLQGAPGTVLVHCASANRAGALLALAAAQHGAMTPVDALAFGRAAGLSSPVLEADVRARLGLPDSND